MEKNTKTAGEAAFTRGQTVDKLYSFRKGCIKQTHPLHINPGIGGFAAERMKAERLSFITNFAPGT